MRVRLISIFSSVIFLNFSSVHFEGRSLVKAILGVPSTACLCAWPSMRAWSPAPQEQEWLAAERAKLEAQLKGLLARCATPASVASCLPRVVGGDGAGGGR